MSAFMVDKAHIDAMVSLAICGPSGRSVAPGRWLGVNWNYPVPGPEAEIEEWSRSRHEARRCNADEVGQMLAGENARSIRYRYKDADEVGMVEDWVDGYRFDFTSYLKRPTAVEGLKIVACYRYQSCEHPGWHDSEASRFCDALEHALISALPGYDEAPWEWRG